VREYLLVVSESEGIAVRAADLPRVGDIIDVAKDYGARERFKFAVHAVEFEVTVSNFPKDGVRGVCEMLPMVTGRVVARRTQPGVWESVLDRGSR